MVGLFDSGSGGLNTVRYLKQTYDETDLVYLIDRENAPYGIKTQKEILEITKRNIDRLTDMGAERVLIACCTASTVHPLLDEERRRISVPIIHPIAKQAKISTRSGRVGVIATDLTVRSHAFAKALAGCEVTELALSSLVGMIDGGLNDGTAVTEDEVMLEKMLLPVLTSGSDTLVLGCTHFPALKQTFGKIASRYGIGSVIDSARIGAEALVGASGKINL